MRHLLDQAWEYAVCLFNDAEEAAMRGDAREAAGLDARGRAAKAEYHALSRVIRELPNGLVVLGGQED